jgi:hypothetical protein
LDKDAYPWPPFSEKKNKEKTHKERLVRNLERDRHITDL